MADKADPKDGGLATRDGLSSDGVMNDVTPKQPEADVWERDNRLPFGNKMILRLKSLVFQAANQTDFAHCAIRTDIKPLVGRPSAALVSLAQLHRWLLYRTGLSAWAGATRIRLLR
jgi:hypothetical protein